jgi:hypothetical protein
MASFALIKNGIVENVIEAEAGSAVIITLENQGYLIKAVDGIEAGIGYNYSDETGFTFVHVEATTTDTGE